MKKKIPIILFCVALVLISINRCSNSKIGKKSDVQISQSDVSLTIKDGTLTNKNATLILKNNSDKTVVYGNGYDIEIKKHGEWYKMNSSDRWFTLSSSFLNVRESKEIEVSLEYGYGKLRKGTYRIIKDMAYESEEHKRFNVAVEFTIK